MRLSESAVVEQERQQVERRAKARVGDSQVEENASRLQHPDDLVHLALDVCDRLRRRVLLVKQSA